MLKTVGTIIMILGGAALIILSFYDNHKKAMKIGTKENNKFSKYLKHKKLLNLMVGFFFVTLGIVSTLNLFNDNLIWILGFIILFLDRALEFKLSKKYQIIN